VTAARREPLIWLQLLGVTALPLELLLVMLVLAGTDPGPVPALERLLAWAIGALAPAILLWRHPADPLSLLLLRAPLRARSLAQRTLMAAPLLPGRLAAGAAALLLLPGLWWIDAEAALAGPIALVPEANRLVALLLTVPVLAMMVWQLQQLAQAIALLLRPPAWFDGLTPLGPSEPESQRLCLGVPLLLIDPLSASTQPSVAPAAVAVEPEQSTEEHNSSNLDQHID
jgi:hypothetical protein